MNAIDNITIKQFKEDGATVLRGVFTEWVDILREGVSENMKNPNSNARIYKGEDGGEFFIDFCSWKRIDKYRDFIFNSEAAEIASTLMGSDNVQLFHEHILIKEAKSGISTPWHHDMPYYCIEGTKTVSLWIPLDTIPKERTLEFIAGSHLWGKSFRPKLFNGKLLNKNDGLEDLPDIDGNKDNYRVLGWDLKPGDAVAFDYRTIHGAQANNSLSDRRRAFSLRMVGDETVFSKKENIRYSPPFNDVSLKNGESLSGEDFPFIKY